MTCSECKFWNQTANVPMMPYQPPQMGLNQLGYGQCRRNAPLAIPAPPGVGAGMMMPQGGVLWPTTAATDACGQFEAKS